MQKLVYLDGQAGCPLLLPHEPLAREELRGHGPAGVVGPSRRPHPRPGPTPHPGGRSGCWPTSPTRWPSGRSWNTSTSARPRSRLPKSATSSPSLSMTRGDRSSSSQPELPGADLGLALQRARCLRLVKPKRHPPRRGSNRRRPGSADSLPRCAERLEPPQNPSQAAPAPAGRRFNDLSVTSSRTGTSLATRAGRSPCGRTPTSTQSSSSTTAAALGRKEVPRDSHVA